MINSFKTKTAALATVGVLALGGGAYAATGSSTAPTPLTGSITDKASDAALAKYPGSTLVGIHSRGDGTYEAEVRRADGTEVRVQLDKGFTVTATRAGGPGGPGAHGGPGGPGRGVDAAALAQTLGVTEAKLRAALQATHDARTDDRTGDRAAEIAKAIGASTADVQAVLDAQGRGGRGPGGPGDRSALVSALAKKTGQTEAAITKALEAVRTAREDAAATALAKALGVDAAKVRTALAAAQPAGRP